MGCGCRGNRAKEQVTSGAQRDIYASGADHDAAVAVEQAKASSGEHATAS